MIIYDEWLLEIKNKLKSRTICNSFTNTSLKDTNIFAKINTEFCLDRNIVA